MFFPHDKIREKLGLTKAEKECKKKKCIQEPDVKI